MADLAPPPAAVEIPAWRPQEGETVRDYLAFWYWAFCGGELDEGLANRHKWAHRKTVLETYEGLHAIRPGEQAQEAVLARVRITLAELMKLEQRVMAGPENTLSNGEILSSVDWLTDISQSLVQQRAEMLDWSKLEPEEREIMLKAKKIQDKLIEGRRS